jgi:hypothetical protein
VKKEENLYLYYSNLGRKMMINTEKKSPQIRKSKMLQGVYTPKIDSVNFQFGRTRSLVDLKQAGSNIISGNKSYKTRADSQKMTKEFKDILQSRKGGRKYYTSSMRTLPASRMSDSHPTEKQMHPKHYPTRRLEQNKLMFNEIFVKPKLDKLK